MLHVTSQKPAEEETFFFVLWYTDRRLKELVIMVLPNLKKYAEYWFNRINVQPGHTVALSIDVEQAEASSPAK